MRTYEKFWFWATALTTACAAGFSVAYAAAEMTPTGGRAGEGQPVANQADRINVPKAPRTIELLLDMQAGPASAAARIGKNELTAAVAAATPTSSAAHASSATEPPTAKVDASSGNRPPGASPLQEGAWDVSSVAGPASTRDQTPTADRDDGQLVPQRGAAEADGSLWVDSAAEDSWIRSTSHFLREQRVAIMVGAASLFGLTWLLSVLVRRNRSTAPRRQSMPGRPADQAHKPRRTRIRIRFRTGEQSHEHGREDGHHDVKREHRRRRRHSRPTAR